MKKLFFLMFLLTGCTKYHYQDCVKITDGFYIGYKGKVSGLDKNDPFIYKIKVWNGSYWEIINVSYSAMQLTSQKECE